MEEVKAGREASGFHQRIGTTGLTPGLWQTVYVYAWVSYDEHVIGGEERKGRYRRRTAKLNKRDHIKVYHYQS